MRIQVLVSMVNDCLSKEEAGELLHDRFHVLISTQELHNSMQNLAKLAGGVPVRGEPNLFFDGGVSASH